MSEWKGDDRVRTLTIGAARAHAWGSGCVGVYLTIERECGSMDAAKAAAEQALREMHDALAAHFAPVLRWDIDMHSSAFLGQWFLQADSEEWSVMVCPPNGDRAVVASGGQCTTRENNRRAAEAALRALGVAFRVEGES